MQALSCNSIEEVLATPNVQISTIKNKLSENIALSTISLLIRDVIESINIPFNMKPEQVIPAAKIIYNQFWNLKLEDIKLCFKNGIIGKYNESNFVRLDVQILILWLQEYNIERILVIENNNHERQKHFNNMYEQISHPKVLELLKSISEKSMQDKILKTDIPTERIKQGQDILFEFDKIYRDQVKEKITKSSGQRFVKVGEKFLNISEYLIFKSNG